ncbi:uncharacterized protein LOC110722896 [Chenopodium quinoa]|uniref:uncharacterized protein LOC110722896 n=1 Tax=Chenopodium quinoa TaxID=63459 RepID=UPI000B7735AB|nr:uncharacterized protein LOC110722896 [Chenopodium quinoa]
MAWSSDQLPAYKIARLYSEEGVYTLERQFDRLLEVLENRRSPRRRRSPSEEDDSHSPRRRREYRQRHHEDNRDRDIKLEFPDFEGNLDHNEFLDWVRSMENVFEYKGYNDEKCFKLAILKLKKHASLWYENLKNRRKKDGKSKITSWEKLKKHMNKAFVPKDYLQDAYLKLNSLKQGTMSVEKYTREFEKLSIMSGIEEAPEHKIPRYIGGLERKLGKKVDVRAHGSFDQVVQKSLKFEKYDKVSSASGYTKPTFKSSFAPKGEISKPIAKDDKGKAPMLSSSKYDHNKMSNYKTCYKCRGYGHFANECPKSRAMMIREMDDDEYEDEKRDFGDPIYDEEDEILVEADEGQILVVKRELHSISTPLAEEQKENIIQTRCTIKDRVCNLIIDSGSCTNVASTTLVSKLNLETTDHPNPCKLQWLNNHNEVKVTKQTLLYFSIGKLCKDEVLCDVLPMDACHVLLGKPWQFDRDVMHDGRKNTYSFMMEKKKIVLNSLSPTIKHKEPLGTGNTIKENLLIGGNEMGKEINQGHLVFICLLRETQESERENPIHPLVKEV